MGIPDLSEGFSPENIDRIYHGQSALVDGEEPGDVLSSEEFEALSHVADGLSVSNLALEMGVGFPRAKSFVKLGLSRLGIAERSQFQLAGYFPLGAAHEIVRHKKLADFGKRARHAEALQGLSEGLSYEQVALREKGSVDSVANHVAKVAIAWTNVSGPLLATTVANAIRAKYVLAVETDPEAMEQGLLGESTLPELKEAEPDILRLIKAQKWAAAEARS